MKIEDFCEQTLKMRKEEITLLRTKMEAEFEQRLIATRSEIFQFLKEQFLQKLTEISDKSESKIETLKNDLKKEIEEEKKKSSLQIEKLRKDNLELKEASAATSNSMMKKQRPEQCEKCEKSFDTPKQLRRHSQQVHKNFKDLTCNICDQNFETDGKKINMLQQFMEALYVIYVTKFSRNQLH